MSKPIIQVAAGIIRNEFGQLYLTQRLEGQDLKRELEEEIGIHILNAELYERFQFEYPTKILDFSFYLVTEWIGEPFGREGQEGFWLEQSELDAGQFPPANLKLIQRLVAESVK